jgi:hypothetical protein
VARRGGRARRTGRGRRLTRGGVGGPRGCGAEPWRAAPDPVVAEVAERLLPGRTDDVAGLPGALFISERPLRRRVLDGIGLAPKVMQRILRFQGFLALAHRTGLSLPPITVLERPDGYYGVDGRHRVSVARALGHRDIEARVTRAGGYAPGANRASSGSNWPARRLIAAGLVPTIVGLIILVASAWTSPAGLALFLIGGAVMGLGGGAMIRGNLSVVVSTTDAAPRQRPSASPC